MIPKRLGESVPKWCRTGPLEDTKMRRPVKNFALVGALILGGLAAACQPESKECHCTQTSCNCPLPPPKPAASDSDKDKNNSQDVSETGGKAHHRAHVARRHGGRHVRTATAGSSRQVHAAAHVRARLRREAARSHARTFHAAGHTEYREARRVYRAGVSHGRVREAASQSFGNDLRWRSSRETAGSWNRHSRGHAYRPLAYGYRSHSHRYASSQEWASAERPHKRGAYSEPEHYSRYSEQHGTRERMHHTHRGETERDGSYDEPDYEAAPEPEARPAQRGGAAGRWMMSINAREARDAWHGYGADCPDWNDE